MKLKTALLGSLVLACGPALACYTVYDRTNTVVYHAQTPPVDMSFPLHQTLPALYPGGHLVFGNDLDCPREHVVARRLPTATATAAPLLTDARTAQDQKLPHTLLSANVALVPAQAAARIDLPTLSIVPADTALARGPDTRTMGAGPAARPSTTITEMHNPPLTAVERRKAAPAAR